MDVTTRKTIVIVLSVLGAWVVVCVVGGVLLVHRIKQVAPGPLGVGKAQAGKPIPCGPEAVTSRKMRDVWRGYYRTQLVTAYRQAGKHDPRWDATAEAYLEGLAALYAPHPDAPDEKKLAALERKLEQLRCDDPLILSRLGALYRQQGKKAQAEAYVTRALAGLKGSKYPPLVLALTYHSMAHLKGEVGSKLESADFQWRPLAIAAYADAAGQKFEPYEQRALWSKLSDLMEDDFRRSQAVIVNALKERPNTDPWLLNMAWGKHCKDIAWVHRGTGWASEVKPEQWEQFEKYSKLAGEYLDKAYQAHPEYPEAPSEMIGIVNSAGGRAGETERLWFDRCVAGQLDYLSAYYGMINALLPRWGGSHHDMLAFGRECLDTARFDTDVPFMYSEAVDFIAERDRSTEVWKEPGVYENLQRCFAGYIKVDQESPYPDDRKKVPDLRTRLALKSYLTGHMDIARQQVDALGGKLDKAAVDRYWGERAELLAGEICAQTGSCKQDVAAAEGLFDAENTTEALAAFEKLLPQEQNPQARFYLQDRIQTLKWEKQLQANEWVALNPTPDLVGWSVWQGEFKPLPQGNGFITTPGSAYAMMVCNLRPGRWFEVQCDVEFPNRDLKGIEAGFLVDVAAACGDPDYDSYRIIRSPATGYSGYRWYENQEHALGSVPRTFKMRLVQCDDRITFYMNNRTVFQDRKLETTDIRAEGPRNIGIGGETYPDPKQPVIYRNIRIHKMK